MSWRAGHMRAGVACSCHHGPSSASDGNDDDDGGDEGERNPRQVSGQ